MHCSYNFQIFAVDLFQPMRADAEDIKHFSESVSVFSTLRLAFETTAAPELLEKFEGHVEYFINMS